MAPAVINYQPIWSNTHTVQQVVTATKDHKFPTALTNAKQLLIGLGYIFLNYH